MTTRSQEIASRFESLCLNDILSSIGEEFNWAHYVLGGKKAALRRPITESVIGHLTVLLFNDCCWAAALRVFG